ncbi:hypothetical protein ACOME3_007809 [Neoechinorhynchus agilis]
MAKVGTGCKWLQKTVELKARSKGCYLITDELTSNLPEIRQFSMGTANLTLLHTSASLALNENWDSSVLVDVNMFLDHAVPRNLPYTHNSEGPDDMPAHIRSILTGCSVTVPITDGRFRLGQWQGIYLCEHRDAKHRRKVLVTVQGVETVN